jgi:hypothetical protein
MSRADAYASRWARASSQASSWAIVPPWSDGDATIPVSPTLPPPSEGQGLGDARAARHRGRRRARRRRQDAPLGEPRRLLRAARARASSSATPTLSARTCTPCSAWPRRRSLPHDPDGDAPAKPVPTDRSRVCASCRRPSILTGDGADASPTRRTQWLKRFAAIDADYVMLHLGASTPLAADPRSVLERRRLRLRDRPRAGRHRDHLWLLAIPLLAQPASAR